MKSRSNLPKILVSMLLIAAVVASALLIVYGAINVGNNNNGGGMLDIITEEPPETGNINNGTQFANAEGRNIWSTLADDEKAAGMLEDHGQFKAVTNYFYTPEAGQSYTLAGSGFNSGASWADYYGNVLSKEGYNNSRKAPDSGQYDWSGNGFKVSAPAIDAILIFTNIRLSPKLIALAQKDILQMKLGFRTTTWKSQNYFRIGMENSNRVYQGALEGQITNTGGEWGTRGHYDRFFDGDSVTLYDNYANANGGNTTPYTSEFVNVKPNNIDKGGIRINFNIYPQNTGVDLDFIVQDVTVEFKINGILLDGNGTVGSPYLIKNAADLITLSETTNARVDVNGKYFKQTANINMNSVPFTPIAKIASHTSGVAPVCVGSSFNGFYNGDNYEIQNLVINDTSGIGNGLFGYIYGAGNTHGGAVGSVKNIKLVSGRIDGSYMTGSIAGYCNGNITNCRNSIAVNSNGTVGGLVGALTSGCNIVDSSNTAAVTSTGTVNAKACLPGQEADNHQLGGIAGVAAGGIYKCYNTGRVSTASGGGHKAGITGILLSSGAIGTCYNLGDVAGSGDRSSGITSRNLASKTSVYNCYNKGALSGHPSYIGEITSSDAWGKGNTNCFDRRNPHFTNGGVAVVLNDHVVTANTPDKGVLWTQGQNYPTFSDGTNEAVRITIEQKDGGTVATPGTNTFGGMFGAAVFCTNKGSLITLSATADTRTNTAWYVFKNHLVNNAGIVGNSFTLEDNATISARFQRNYIINVYANNGTDHVYNEAQEFEYTGRPQYYVRTLADYGISFAGMNRVSWNTAAGGNGYEVTVNQGRVNLYGYEVNSVVNMYAIWNIDNPTVDNLAPITGAYTASGYTLTAVPRHDANTAIVPITYSYQWYFGGSAISGATAASINIVNVADSGNYKCAVTANAGRYGNRSVTTNEVAVAIAGTIKTEVTLGFGNAAHGTASVLSAGHAYGNDIVNLTVTPNAHYNIDKIYWNNTANIIANDAYAGFLMPENTNEVTIVVSFVAINYNISYNLNHSGSMSALPYNFTGESATYNIENLVISLPVPTRGYYDFAGWFATRTGTLTPLYSTDNTFGDPLTKGTNDYTFTVTDIGSTPTFYAKWTPIEYDLSYYFGTASNTKIQNLQLEAVFVGNAKLPTTVNCDDYKLTFENINLLTKLHPIFSQITDFATKFGGFNTTKAQKDMDTITAVEFVNELESNTLGVYVTANVEMYLSTTSFDYTNGAIATELKVRDFVFDGTNYKLNYSKVELLAAAKDLGELYISAITQYGLELYYNSNLISTFYGAAATDTATLATLTLSQLDTNRNVTINGVYKKYSVKYIDTFNGGATEIGGLGDNSYTFNIETSLSFPHPTPQAGFSFDKYYTTRDFVTETTGVALGTTGDITVYANWQLIAPTFKFTDKVMDGGYYKYSITYNSGTLEIIGAGVALASGATFTYQWQYSSDGNVFTNMDGATTTAITVGAANKGVYYYRVLVIATASGYTSSQIESSVAELTIGDKTITNGFISALLSQYEYQGAQITPTPTVRDGSKLLVDNVDYRVAFGLNLNASVNGGTVTITGFNNYKGEVVVTFTITQKGITIAFSNNTNLIYDGSVRKITAEPVGYVLGEVPPVLSVTYNKDACNVGSDYIATVTLFNPNGNYKLIKDGADVASYSNTFAIAPKPIAITFEQFDDITYDGLAHDITAKIARRSDICAQGSVDDIVNVLLSYDKTERINVGTYTASASLSNGNYVIDGVNSQAFNIITKKIRIAPKTYTKLFGTADPAFNFIVPSGVERDGDLAVMAVRDTTSSDFWAHEDIATYQFSALSYESANYDITLSSPCTLKIEKNNIYKIAPIAANKVYGEKDPVFTNTLTPSSIIAGGIIITVTFTRTVGEARGKYDFSTDFTYAWNLTKNASDYFLIGITQASDYVEKFVISPKHIDISIDAQSKLYGDPDPAKFTYTLDKNTIPEIDGGVNADLNVLFANAILMREEGNNYKENGYKYIFNLKNDNYVARIISTTVFMINKRTIEITTPSTITTSKTYDGNTSVYAVLGATNLSKDLLTTSGFAIKADYADKNCGDNITINVAYSLNLSEVNNYIVPKSYTVQGAILKKKLVVSIENTTMVYGSAIPQMEIKYDGFIIGENITNAGITTLATINYGELSEKSETKNYTVTLITGSANNYDFDVTDTAEVKVTPAKITVSAGEKFVRRIDGTTNAALTPNNYVISGLKEWDKENFTLYFTANLKSGGQGETEVIMTLIGTSNLNYELNSGEIVYIPAEILPLPVITITKGSFPYDGTQKTLEIKAFVKDVPYSNLKITYTKIGGETESESAPVNAGSYLVKVVPKDAEYSSVVATAMLVITKLMPVIELSGNFEQIYGQFAPLKATISATNLSEELEVSYTFGDDLNPDVGVYDVVARYSGAENYESTSYATVLTIKAKDIKVTFKDFINLVYNGAVQMPSVLFEGAVDGDNLSATLQYLDNKIPRNAGAYSLTVFVYDDNYHITNSCSLQYTIAKRALQVVVAEGGTATPNKIDIDISFNGFAENEDVKCLANLPAPKILSNKVGDVEIVLSGGNDVNYTFVYPDVKPQVKLTYTPQQKANMNKSTIYIVVGSLAFVGVIIAIVAIINKRKMVNEFVAEQAKKSKKK